MTPSRSLRILASAGISVALTVVPNVSAAKAVGTASERALCAGVLQSAAPTVQNPAVTELSGLAWSRRYRGLLWAHNDSGDTARVFAVGRNGSDRGTVTVAGATAIDWEDIALGPAPHGKTYLYAGDIGDNFSRRPGVTVYRFFEPKPPGSGATTSVAAEAITLTYPDGPHDAEALIVDDRSGDLVIITKSINGPPGIYVGRRAAVRPVAPVTLEHEGDLSLPLDPRLKDRLAGLGVFAGLAQLVTGADASAAGKVVAVRTYGGVALYGWPRGMALTQALQQPACAGPAPADPDHPQGEAIALAPDARAYVLASEGANPPLREVTAGHT